MGQYKCKNTTVSSIAETFGVTPDNVEALNELYNKLIDCVPYQYLAHIIRNLESYVRSKEKSPKFKILCLPMKGPTDTVKQLACARYKKGSSFTIVYDDRIDEKQKRIVIAHELGHLFLAVEAERGYEENHEPLSSVFGVISMLHKNEVAGSKIKVAEVDLIKEFSLFMNSQLGEFNVSN